MSSYRSSRRYGTLEVTSLLRAVDRHLGSPASMVIIGGGAAAFHGATSTTGDVDTLTDVGEDLRSAIDRAVAETGFAIPVSHAAVADVPWNWQDRLERQLPELANLEVWILEKHDLVLSKVIRGDEHDEQQILEIQRSVGLDVDVLVQRFRDEMGHVTGDSARIRSQFVQLVELLFGELKRVAAERSLATTS